MRPREKKKTSGIMESQYMTREKSAANSSGQGFTKNRFFCESRGEYSGFCESRGEYSGF